MEGEPAFNEEDNCMVVILDNMTGDGAALHAKMDKCEKTVHNFVCVAYPCGYKDVECWGQNVKTYKKKGQEHGILLPPKLEIR
jgi:hypothetical protein